MESGYFLDYRNYLTLLATISLLAFPAAGYILEKLKSRKLIPSTIVSVPNSSPNHVCLCSCMPV